MGPYDISYWLRRGAVHVRDLVQVLARFPHDALLKIDDNTIVVRLIDDQETSIPLEQVTKDPNFKPPNFSSPDIGLELTLARLACAQALDCLAILEAENGTGEISVLGRQWLNKTREALCTILDRGQRKT